MSIYYAVNKREQQHMSCFVSTGWDLLRAIFEHLPEKIINHSKRVENITSIMVKHMPKELLPEKITFENYCLALSKGAYYHDIGVYLAGNNVKLRPASAEKLLVEHWHMDVSLPFSRVLFSTARNCCERYDGKGYPDSLIGECVPFHASLCGIADAVDMIMDGKKLNERKAKKAADYILLNSSILFRPDAVHCFELAEDKIFDIYK